MTAPQDPSATGPWQQGGQPPGGQQPGGFGPPPPPPPAQAPYGQSPYGQSPYGQAPYGQAPYGQAGAWQGPPLAGWGTRALGYLIDAVISFAIQLVVSLVDPTLGSLAGLGVAIWFGYVTGTTGQTPGRKAVGIKVLREADGQPLGPGAGIGRLFLHIVDALPLFIGFFWPLWDRKKQTFADKIIGSVVIKI